jgi:hypothetical protein
LVLASKCGQAIEARKAALSITGLVNKRRGFRCDRLHVSAQFLLGYKSLETPRIDVGNALLGGLS